MNETRKSLRRHIIGFVGAVSMGCAAALYPSDVAGASTLHGLVIEVQGAPCVWIDRPRHGQLHPDWQRIRAGGPLRPGLRSGAERVLSHQRAHRRIVVLRRNR